MSQHRDPRAAAAEIVAKTREAIDRYHERKKTLAPLPANAMEIRDSMLAVCRYAMTECKKVEIVGLIFTHSNPHSPILLPCEDLSPRGKDAFVEQLNAITTIFPSSCVGIASEVWRGKHKKDAVKQLRPSEDPDRTEALMIVAEWQDTSTTWMFTIARDGAGNFVDFVVDEDDWPHDKPAHLNGRFAQLLAPDDLPPEYRAFARTKAPELADYIDQALTSPVPAGERTH